jgi:uncharacterized protein
LAPKDRRGFAALPKPSRGDVFYDIEGDPLFDSRGSLEYLHGLWWVDADTGEHMFNPIWSHDREQEREGFKKLIDFFFERRAEFPNMRIYHYAPYETTALKRLAQTHGVCEEELDVLLREEVFVDLYRVTRQALQASVESYSIKKIEKFYMREREAELQAGDDSIVLYEMARELEGGERQAILDGIAAYNEEDCKSTFLLREWLVERKEEALEQLQWIGEEGPIRRSEDARNASPASGEPSRYDLRKEGLLLAAANARAAGEELMAELVQFFLREGKASSWSWFAAKEMLESELIRDNTEALAGLEPAGEGEGGSKRFTFPPQDYKVRADKSVRDPIEDRDAGKVVAIDSEARTIDIELSATAASQPPRAVIEHDRPYGIEPIEGALIDLAASLDRPAGTAARFPAAEKLLRREPPLFGEALEGATDVERRELVDDMRGSYLVIQGPPGTGKTHTAADLIVDQLIKGRRVGVSAFTHTAVNTLVSKVEECARRRGHVFRGVKKETSGRTPYFESEEGFVETAFKNDAAAFEDAELIAGTAWLLSRAEWRQQLDYVFIDEAGQMSLAMALAVGTAGQGLVLLGDPNQLPQVLKGSHPPGAEASALEHVLGDHATIPPELGLFLPDTRRMPPAICGFISDSFYEGRLRSHVDAGVEREFPQTLGYIPVPHDGNRQASEEEASAIFSEVARIVGGGVPPGEVMIVTPYNAQVDTVRDYFRRRDPALAREINVCTVDKCQGQEADAVLYSMAASGDADVPRGAGFLFSANRFNVAISRARHCAFLVCDPRLLATEVKTVESMRLLNAFVHYTGIAERIG